MAEVIPFTQKEDGADAHLTGQGFCLHCHHDWVAVAPLGTVWLECPECGTNKATFREHVELTGEPAWTCKCDNQLFTVHKNGIFCPNCGSYQVFP